MNKNEIESIVKDTLEFVEEEMFATTAGEKRDLKKFLRERLSRPTTAPADGVYCACNNPTNNTAFSGNCGRCGKPRR